MCIFQKTPLHTPPGRPLCGLPVASQKSCGCPGERVLQLGEPGPARPGGSRPPTAPTGSLTPSLRAPSGPGGGQRGLAASRGLAGGSSTPARRAWVPVRKASGCVVPSSPASDASNRLRKSPDNKQASEQINDNNNNRSPISLVAWEKVGKVGLPGSGVGGNGSSGSHSRGSRPGRLS